MKLKIGTFNILNTSCRYEERLPYLKKSILDLDCDVLGIQEVNYSGNSELLNIENYTQVFIQLPFPFLKQEPTFRIDGNMLLIRSNIEILQSYELIFSNQLRVAQFVRLKKENFE